MAIKKHIPSMEVASPSSVKALVSDTTTFTELWKAKKVQKSRRDTLIPNINGLLGVFSKYTQSRVDSKRNSAIISVEREGSSKEPHN